MKHFSDIYKRQEEFEDLIIDKHLSYNKPLREFDRKERVDLSKELCLYLHTEISEYVNALGNYRHHKTKNDSAKIKDVKEEVADMFIYVMDLALTVGMTANEVLDKISKKQDVNFKRQEEGY